MMKNKKSAKSLAVGDVFRPNADRRFAATWYRVERVFPGERTTTVDYCVVDADHIRGTLTTASLATMEII